MDQKLEASAFPHDPAATSLQIYSDNTWKCLVLFSVMGSLKLSTLVSTFQRTVQQNIVLGN